jgi:hypothetical protein
VGNFPAREVDDLQGSCNEEISKSEILDLICAVRSSENIDEKNSDDWPQSDACEPGF